MSDQVERILMRLAQAISDGTPIDWDLEVSARPELGQLLEGLKLVESVSRTRRPGGEAEAAPSQSWGPLRLIERIGHGAFAEVYRAYDPMLHREVALKLFMEPLDPNSRHEMLEEGRRLARVRHPNILVVHGADEHDGRLGLWTDLVRGRTLEEIVREDGVLGEREAAGIGLDLCHALAAVHGAGMIHRDVKAANVMREDGGRIVLMDFGCVLDESDETDDLSRSSLRGTPIAMAPEVLAGAPATVRSDLYSLGVLLYRLASGRYPVEAANFEELLEKHRRNEAVPIRDRRPDLSRALTSAIDRALQPQASKRYRSAGAFEHSLQDVLAARQTGSGEPRRRKNPVRRIAPYAVSFFVLAAAFFFGRMWVQQNASSSSKAVRQTQPTPPPSPPAAEPLTATARLFRETGGGSEALADGARVSPGDGLYMRFEAPERVWLYVLDEDEHGVTSVLYPAPGLDGGNPLEGEQFHRLPGTRDGKVFDWQVTSAGGHESVIAIASKAPIPELESDIAGFPHADHQRPVVYGHVGARTLERLRGITGVVQQESLPSGPPHGLSSALQRLGNTSASPDVWMWQIRLANP